MCPEWYFASTPDDGVDEKILYQEDGELCNKMDEKFRNTLVNHKIQHRAV